MQGVVLEKRIFDGGVEYPIECYQVYLRKRKASAVSQPHYHRHVEFLFATGECDVSVWIDGETVSFGRGDLIIINPGVAHNFTSQLDTSTYICVKAMTHMMYSADSTFFDLKYVNSFFGNGTVKYRYYSSENMADDSPREMFIRVAREWTDKRYGYEISLKSHLLDIFLWAVRHDRAEQRYGGLTETARLIHHSAEFIKNNYADATEETAASEVNMSYSHYSRQFKRVMGISFSDFLMSTRITAAERLLLSTDMSVTEISQACGFATSSHLIDRFKRDKGVTPGRYRQIWQGRAINDLK